MLHFEIIRFYNLKKGVKYYIVDHYPPKSFTGIFIGYNLEHAVFKSVKYEGKHIGHVIISCSSLMIYKKLISSKEKIQQAMEERALNKILNHLIEGFIWK